MTRHRSKAIVSAAMLVAAGTWAQADVVCKNKKGVLASRPACKSKETQIDPALLGLVGPKGDKGDAGPGARWALVKGDGTIVAQTGGITVSHPRAGEYYVGFGSISKVKPWRPRSPASTASVVSPVRPPRTSAAAVRLGGIATPLSTTRPSLACSCRTRPRPPSKTSPSTSRFSDRGAEPYTRA